MYGQRELRTTSISTILFIFSITAQICQTVRIRQAVDITKVPSNLFKPVEAPTERSLVNPPIEFQAPNQLNNAETTAEPNGVGSRLQSPDNNINNPTSMIGRRAISRTSNNAANFVQDEPEFYRQLQPPVNSGQSIQTDAVGRRMSTEPNGFIRVQPIQTDPGDSFAHSIYTFTMPVNTVLGSRPIPNSVPLQRLPGKQAPDWLRKNMAGNFGNEFYGGGNGFPGGRDFNGGNGFPGGRDFNGGNGFPGGSDFNGGNGFPGGSDFNDGNGFPRGSQFNGGTGFPTGGTSSTRYWSSGYRYSSDRATPELHHYEYETQNGVPVKNNYYTNTST